MQLSSTGYPIPQAGPLAGRPAIGKVQPGFIYEATDTSELYIAINGIWYKTGTTVIPLSPMAPLAPTNVRLSADGTMLLWTPPVGAESQIVSLDGTPVAPYSDDTTSSYLIPTNLAAGSHTYSIRGHNSSAGDGPSSSVTFTITAPTPPAQPTGLNANPNAGNPIFTWPVDPAATAGYQLVIDGGSIIPLTDGLGTYSLTGTPQSSGTHTAALKAVSSAGASTAESITYTVPTLATPIILTDGTTVQGPLTPPAGTTIDHYDSASITPVAGETVYAPFAGYMPDGSFDLNVTDNFGDTGGSSWQVYKVTGSGPGDNYIAGVAFRTIGALPSAGKVTIHRITSAVGGNVYWWVTVDVGRLAHAASPVAVQSPASAQGTAASQAVAFANAVDPNSIVIMAGVSGQASGNPVKPTGFTSLDTEQPAVAASFFAYKIGSVAQTNTVTGLGTYANAIIAVEIGQAAGAAPAAGKPSAPTNVHPVVTQGAGGATIGMTFDSIVGVGVEDGYDIWDATFVNVDSDTGKIAWPRTPSQSPGTSWTDPGLYGPGDYVRWIAGYNAHGVGPATMVTIHVAAASGNAALQASMGSAGETPFDDGNSWENGQEVLNFFNATHCQGGYAHVWSPHTVNGALGMINQYRNLTASGKAYHGIRPVFDLALGGADMPLGQVVTGAHDADIHSIGAAVQAGVAAGQYTKPHLRIAWEPNLGFAWHFGSDLASQNAYRADWVHMGLILLAECPTAVLVFCGFTADFDYSAAIPWWNGTDGFSSAQLKVGMDLYADGQGPGTGKLNGSTDPFAPPQDAAAYLAYLWTHNANPPAPGTGSWLWNLVMSRPLKTAGDPLWMFCFPEFGEVAREAAPNAGGGDFPEFLHFMRSLIATGRSEPNCYFPIDLTLTPSPPDPGFPNGSYQKHDITDGHFTRSLAAYITDFGT